MTDLADATLRMYDQGNGTWKSSPAAGGNIIANPWIRRDFNGLSNGQSVVDTVNDPGSVPSKSWSSVLGSIGYAGGAGVQGSTVVAAPGKTSSCAVSILEGSDGDPSGGDTGVGSGAWGGTIDFPTPIEEGDEFWYGDRIWIPTGYDWNHGSGASKPGFIKHLRVNNDANGQRLEHHIINGSWDGSASDSTQVGWSLANEFDPKAQEETHKASDKILTLGAWHWVEFYIYAHSDPAQAIRRLWVDRDLVFERVGANNRWRDENGEYQTETLSSGERSLPNSAAALISTMHGTYYNGYAPQDQTYYIDIIVAHNVAAEVLDADTFGNKMMGPQ
jgi:hypothetical protein